MSSSGLDAIFQHYVAAVLRQAKLWRVGDQWYAEVQFMSTNLQTTAMHEDAARNELGQLVETAAFDQLRRGRFLPIIDGIDLNGGSC